MADLTKGQKAFIEYYMQTLNPQEAAILAGYDRDNAIKVGNSMLNSKRVMEGIHKKVEKHAKNLFVTRSYIVQKLLDIIEFSLQKETILNKDGTESDRIKLKDVSSGLKALISLAKLVEGCEKIAENNDESIEVENLNVEKI